MSTPSVIGIGGRLRSGKDTIADYLVEHHGYVKMGMSEPLNDALLTLNPWIPVRLLKVLPWVVRYQKLHDRVGYTEAKTNPEVRRLLQMLGTEVGRNMIDEEVWTDIARRRIEAITAEGGRVILTGVRFPNELEMISSLGGETWYVERPDLEETALSAHDSERGLTPGDFTVVFLNDSTIESLLGNVENYLY